MTLAASLVNMQRYVLNLNAVYEKWAGKLKMLKCENQSTEVEIRK